MKQVLRNLIKYAACTLAVVMVLGALPGGLRQVFAASETVEVTLTEDYVTCIFQIQWENREQDATVEVHAPDGTVYSESATPEKVSAGDGNVLVNVGAASSGSTWRVVITGEGLGRVTVDGGALPGSMEITAFHVNAVDAAKGEFHASWSVTDCPEQLQIELYADTDASGFDGQRVASFQGGPSGEQDFTISGLDTGDYFFYIRVAASEGMFNRAYAQGSFPYADPSAPEKLTGVKARLLNEEVLLTWEMGEHTDFKVFFWDKASGALLFEDEVSGDNGYEWTIPEGQGDLLAAVAARHNNRTGRYDRLEVAAVNPVNAEVAFPDGESFNTRTVVAKVSFEGDCTVSATLNGELCLEAETRQGDYRVDLDEGESELIFLIEDAKGNLRSFMKRFYVDCTPPQLAVYRELDGTQTTDDYIYLSGYSEQGATLLFNGESVPMENGYFNIRCALKMGDNALVLTARDVAGNESVYNANVKRMPAGGNWWQWILVGAVVVALIVIYTVLYLRRARELRREKKEQRGEGK
jgi:hypothetical protein